MARHAGQQQRVPKPLPLLAAAEDAGKKERILWACRQAGGPPGQGGSMPRRQSVPGPAQLIRIEATFEVASILGSRKPGMPRRVSSRVWRHEKVGSVCLTMV